MLPVDVALVGERTRSLLGGEQLPRSFQVRLSYEDLLGPCRHEIFERRIDRLRTPMRTLDSRRPEQTAHHLGLGFSGHDRQDNCVTDSHGAKATPRRLAVRMAEVAGRFPTSVGAWCDRFMVAPQIAADLPESALPGSGGGVARAHPSALAVVVWWDYVPALNWTAGT